MKNQMIRRSSRALQDAFVTPGGKQREAYARFLHNLSAACFIAATSILFTVNSYGAAHVAALLAIGVICFLAGAVLCKGD